MHFYYYKLSGSVFWLLLTILFLLRMKGFFWPNSIQELTAAHVLHPTYCLIWIGEGCSVFITYVDLFRFLRS
nr:hypothetical protein Iba_chr08dCG12820 [Ipomoea batatas]GMD27341.1 hypothetical protein Iba_chr08dCG12830 [Ipomoea batatas]